MKGSSWTFEGTRRAKSRRRHLIPGLKTRRGAESRHKQSRRPPRLGRGGRKSPGAEAHPKQNPEALSGSMRRRRALHLRMIPYPPFRPLDLEVRPLPRE